MTKINSKNKPKQAISVSVFLILFSFMVSLSGCGDSNVTNVQSDGSTIRSAGENIKDKYIDTTIIQLDMNLKFKSESITDSKILESNIGNNFNHIVSFSRELKPGQEIDLQEIQPFGIFGLYLSANGNFSLSNSDGMSFSSKLVLMEKCSFIDLKLRNEEQKIINVTGLVAGE